MHGHLVESACTHFDCTRQSGLCKVRIRTKTAVHTFAMLVAAEHHHMQVYLGASCATREKAPLNYSN